MKIYVNWEWQEIFKTEVEAKDCMIANGICDNFGEYLANELDLSVEDAFNLDEDEKAEICKKYIRYVDEALQDCWEIVEI